MIILEYILISLLAFLGLIIGAILSFIAPEELKPLKKYFRYFYKVIIALVLIVFIVFKGLSILTSVLLLLLFAFLLSIESMKPVIYSVMPLFLYSLDNRLVLTESILVFILSIVLAAVFIEPFEKKQQVKNKLMVLRKLLCKYYYYVFVVIILVVLKI